MRLVRPLGALVMAGALAGGPAHAADSGEEPVLLVVSSSATLAEEVDGVAKVEALRDGATRAITQLPDTRPVGLRVYGSEQLAAGPESGCDDTQMRVSVGVDNRDRLLPFLTELEPYGGAAIPSALELAAVDLDGAGRIVLVADAVSTCEPDPCQAASEVAGDGLTIDVIGLGVDGEAREQLGCIAESGGGSYVDAETADDVAAAIVSPGGPATRPEPDAGPTERSADAAPTAGARTTADLVAGSALGVAGVLCLAGAVALALRRRRA